MTKPYINKRIFRTVLIITIVAAITAGVFSLLSLYLERLVFYSCVGPEVCELKNNTPLMLVRLISSDLAQVGRYVFELGVIASIVLLIRKVFVRK